MFFCLLDSQNDNDFLVHLLIGIVLFLIGVALTRSIFSIPLLVRHSKAQTRLLAKMAEKQGIDNSFIEETLNDAEDYYLLQKGHFKGTEAETKA
jgi:hypothetical protein